MTGLPVTSTVAHQMSYKRFERTILPHAVRMWYKAEHAYYATIHTAVDPDAPLLFKWQHPFNWYVYFGGSNPGEFNLRHSQLVPVTGLCNQPSMWGGEDHHTQFQTGAIFLLEGAYDTRNHSLCFFPMTLRGELHEVHQTIEMYGKNRRLEGKEQASACGVKATEGKFPWPLTFKVDTSTTSAYYTLVDWD